MSVETIILCQCGHEITSEHKESCGCSECDKIKERWSR